MTATHSKAQCRRPLPSRSHPLTFKPELSKLQRRGTFYFALTGRKRRCRSNVRSSSLGKVGGAALMGHGGTQRGVVDVGTGSGPAEGIACSKSATYHADASSP